MTGLWLCLRQTRSGRTVVGNTLLRTQWIHWQWWHQRRRRAPWTCTHRWSVVTWPRSIVQRHLLRVGRLLTAGHDDLLSMTSSASLQRHTRCNSTNKRTLADACMYNIHCCVSSEWWTIYELVEGCGGYPKKTGAMSSMPTMTAMYATHQAPTQRGSSCCNVILQHQSTPPSRHSVTHHCVLSIDEKHCMLVQSEIGIFLTNKKPPNVGRMSIIHTSF